MKTRNLVTIALVAIVVIAALAATHFLFNDGEKDGPDADDRASVAVGLLEDGEFETFYDSCDPVLQASLGR